MTAAFQMCDPTLRVGFNKQGDVDVDSIES